MTTPKTIHLEIGSFHRFIDPIIVLDGSWRTLYLNPAAEALLGAAREDLIGSPFEQILRLENTPFTHEEIRAIVEKDEWWRAEIEYPTGDGRRHWFEWSIYHSIQTESGQKGPFLHVRDITQIKRAETEHRKLLNVIEFLPDATFVLDREKRVIAWNRAVEEMTGVAKEEIIGKGDYAYAVPFYGERRPIVVDLIDIDRKDWEPSYDFVKTQGETLFAEVYVPSLYNGRGAYIWVTASPLFDESGNRVGAIESVRDITVRKQAELEIQKRNAELKIQSARLEEANTALKVLLEHKEQDRVEMEKRVHTNMKKLVLPNLDRMKSTRLSLRQTEYMSLLETNLDEVLSPFMIRLSEVHSDLTPKEIEVANLIKAGKTTKEIAEYLAVSEDAVKFHRNNIRKKMRLNGKKANLRSHLMGMSQPGRY